MALSKGNLYTEIFQYFFIKKFEHGAVDLLNTQWKRDQPDCDEDEATALGWQKLISVFLMFSIGIFLALVILILEKFGGRTYAANVKSNKNMKHVSSDLEKEEMTNKNKKAGLPGDILIMCQNPQIWHI